MPIITIIDDLEDCPFCGSSAVQHEEQGSVIVECTKCGAGMVGDTEEEVVSAWNSRNRKEEQLIKVLVPTVDGGYTPIYLEGTEQALTFAHKVGGIVVL